MTEHPIFHEGGDQLTMITAALDVFPGQAGNPDVQVPIHPRVRQAWAKALIQRGMVLVPSLMEELPAPTGDHPEAGWLQPVEWMKRAKYEERMATAPAPTSTPEQQKHQAETMLQAIKPDLAERIAAMSDPEKRAAMADMAKRIPQHIDVVRTALEQIEKQRNTEAGNA